MRKALVVGINDYPRVPLKGCINDANAIANALATHGDGSPNFDVRLATCPPTSMDRSTLRGAIETLFSGEPEVALFYFSGHGFVKSTGGYIVTTDFKKYDEGVSMDEILVLCSESRAKDKIVILDCCHSGAFGSPAISANAAHLPDGLTVLTASRDSEAALEVNGCGIFTSLVVDALLGGAADVRGHVTPGSVYSYVDQALGAWEQRPIFKTNVSRFTSLRMIPPRISPTVLRRICVHFKSPQDVFLLDPGFEDTSSVPDPNKVPVFKDLQKLFSVGLVVPVDEEFMYFAAMNSKACRLTALGYHYWRLVNEKRV
jgi:uncharacterized caspase-like protein